MIRAASARPEVLGSSRSRPKAMTEFGLILGAGLLALTLTALFARPLLSHANRLRSATAIVGTIVSGVRSCLRLHGRALAVLASPIAFCAFIGIGVVRAYAPSDPVASTYTHAAWTTLSMLFGSLSALLATHVSTQVSVRGASSTHTALREGDVGILRAAMRAGIAASLATHAILLLGLAVLAIAAFSSSGGFSGQSNDAPLAMARLVSGYGVGAALGSLFAHAQGGSFVAVTRVLALVTATSSVPRPHPTDTTNLIGEHLDLGTGRTSDAHSTSATGTVIAMLLCATIVQSNPGAFRTASAVVLTPLLGVAFSTLGSAVGMLVVRTDGVEPISVVFDRGLAVTVVLSLGTYVGLSRWLLADQWLGAFGAAAAGVAAFIAVVLLVRVGARRAVLLTRLFEFAGIGALSRGLLHAALTVLIATVAAGSGFVAGRTTGLHQGGEFGLVFVLLGFLAPTPYLLASASLGSVVRGTLGIARYDVGRARIAIRAERWEAAADDALSLARATAPIGAALVAWVGVATFARMVVGGSTEDSLLMPPQAWGIVAGAAALGVILVLWMGAAALASVDRTLRAVVPRSEVSTEGDDVARMRDPSVLASEVLQETVRQSVPRVLLAVSLPLLGWVAVRWLAGEVAVAVVATCWALATASLLGLGLSAVSEGSGGALRGVSMAFSAPEPPADKTAVDVSKNWTKNPHGASVVAVTRWGALFESSSAPASTPW